HQHVPEPRQERRRLREHPQGPPSVARLRDPRRARGRGRARVLPRCPAWASGRGRGRPRHRRGGDRLTDTNAAPAGGAETEELRGELREQLASALRRVPELGDAELHLLPLSGGITNRNFLISIDGRPDRYVVRLAGNDTHLLGISREVEHAATVAAA